MYNGKEGRFVPRIDRTSTGLSPPFIRRGSFHRLLTLMKALKEQLLREPFLPLLRATSPLPTSSPSYLEKKIFGLLKLRLSYYITSFRHEKEAFTYTYTLSYYGQK